MIALIPQLLLTPKGATAAKSVPPAESPANEKNAAPAPDFAAWVAKALAGQPLPTADPKTSAGKAGVKLNSAEEAAKASQVPDPNLAAILGAEPPPTPLPSTPPTPAPAAPGKLVGHFVADAKPQASAAGSSATSEIAVQPAAGAAAASPHAKANAPPHAAAIKPPLPEMAAKPSGAKSAAVPDGMAVAQNEERMNSAAEQNKIAGQATQKLPPVGSVSSAAAVKPDASAAKLRLPVDFSPRDDAAQQVSLNASKMPAVADSTASVAAATASAIHATSPLDRVEQMIAREAIVFKQSGANEVGVSLKIDAHTQLFLQLSYRDGQTQAVLRCEKGDLPALNSHFGQLQESLARQNIQLQPASDGGLDFNRQDSSGRQWQDSASQAEAPLKDEAKSTTANQPQSKPTSRRGWESWA